LKIIEELLPPCFYGSETFAYFHGEISNPDISDFGLIPCPNNDYILKFNILNKNYKLYDITKSKEIIKMTGNYSVSEDRISLSNLKIELSWGPDDLNGGIKLKVMMSRYEVYPFPGFEFKQAGRDEIQSYLPSF